MAVRSPLRLQVEERLVNNHYRGKGNRGVGERMSYNPILSWEAYLMNRGGEQSHNEVQRLFVAQRDPIRAKKVLRRD